MSSAPPVVLVIDDEASIRRFLRAGFELHGFSVQEAATGSEGVRTATARPADLIIVDLGLPDMDGSEVVRQLTTASRAPIIVLSVRSHEDEKVKLLELGADDYVVKPFGMAELAARCRAALRRQTVASSGEHIVRAGRLEIDLSSRRVMLEERTIQLSRKEYRLLQILAQHGGTVVTQQQLLNEVWGPTNIDNAHYLRILVRKLRQKIESDPTRPDILLTELGVGYRLLVSPL